MEATSNTITPLVLEPGTGQSAGLSEFQKSIVRLKEEKNAVILAHNYQIPEIQEIADYLGDSLGLSYQAAEAKADIICFCGVHFMAETAKIISPEKTVILPDMDAGCSLSDSCPPEKLAAYKEKYPNDYIVAYINCSAGVKALADVICTSGNAVKIVEQVPEDRDILFVPDQNLGQWVANQMGRRIKLWPGSCYAHVLFSKEQIARIKLDHPGAKVVAHPECVESVRQMADIVCSTEKMVHFCKDDKAQAFIVVTETGMLHRLRKEIPEKVFIAGPTETCACNDCRYMKLNTLEKLYNCLDSISPRIELSSEIIERAALPIQRMLDWSR